MSDEDRNAIDPDSPYPMGDLSRFTRPRRDPKRYLVPFILALVITLAAIGVLTLIIWAILRLFF